eukprot:10862069-Alexandrium_andersonii.AAC.1
MYIDRFSPPPQRGCTVAAPLRSRGSGQAAAPPAQEAAGIRMNLRNVLSDVGRCASSSVTFERPRCADSPLIE